jgi:SAM-dependent methyltransferase
VNAELTGLLEVPLCDLGEIDTRLDGIYCPREELGAEKVGITEQFLGDAENYSTRYANSAHFRGLFEQAFAAAGIVPQQGLTILDIGTGAGTNSVHPCLVLFEGCRIVATDLSPDLLRILRQDIVSNHLEDRVICVCTDAMNNFFRPSSFDIVVGAAILHHLLDPGRALAAAYRALKPGGIAIFFEPFEGVALLRLAFDLILQRAASDSLPLDPAAAKLLAALSLDYSVRAGSDKSAPHFRYMDDKWLFTRDWLERASREAGFGAMTIVPHSSHATLFRDYVTVLLKLGASLRPENLPDWAWEIIASFDRGLSPEMKRDLLLEGTIVLHKGTSVTEIALRDATARIQAIEASTIWRLSGAIRTSLAARPRLRRALKAVLRPAWRAARTVLGRDGV